MHRSVADIVHAVRVPGARRVLRRAVRHAVRQALETQETRPGRRNGRVQQAAAAVVRLQQSARFRKQRGRGQRELGRWLRLRLDRG